jgi:hypothetical protein
MVHDAHLYSTSELVVPGPGYRLPRLEKNKEDGEHLCKGAFLFDMDVIQMVGTRSMPF